MKMDFGFGDRVETVDIPDQNLIGILTTNVDKSSQSEKELILYSLDHPINSKRLRNIVNAGEKIVIVTSDITRPMPSYKILPFILDELYSVGVSPADVTLVFALGSHRKHTAEERRTLAGERAYREITCIDSDATDSAHLGTTNRGTPVDIMRLVAEADRRICLGNIEYHYFAGYSGGAKAIMPGVASYDTIHYNHKLMVNPAACAGSLKGNPVREDIEEAASLCCIDFILNVILDEHKRIVHVVSGHPISAHRQGCRFIDELYGTEINERADIVLVSQGGSPKDMNLYQTQKALDNASHAVKEGGVIILIGSCKEGLGGDVFEKWLLEADTPNSLIRRLQTEFKLGGHKAAAIAMVLQHADVYLVSDLDDSVVRKIFLTPYHSAQNALENAFKKLGDDATVLAMPYGGSTLPRIVRD
jgi:nickel-dependent lactate racemase